MPQHQPCFINDDRCRLPLQRPLNTAKQIKQHRQGVFFAQPHQLLNFKGHEVAERQPIGFRVQQMPHRAFHRILLECLADAFVLNTGNELGQAMRAGLVHGQCHYLIAWCEDAKGLRSFSLPNITDIFPIKVHYLKDPAFNLQEYAQRSFGVCQEEPYDVAWRFPAAVADAVHEHHFHPSQRIEEQPDGSLIVRFKAGGWKEMCWCVMRWEGHAEILEPAHLRQSYNEMVQHLCKQAGKLR